MRRRCLYETVLSAPSSSSSSSSSSTSSSVNRRSSAAAAEICQDNERRSWPTCSSNLVGKCRVLATVCPVNNSTSLSCRVPSKTNEPPTRPGLRLLSLPEWKLQTPGICFCILRARNRLALTPIHTIHGNFTRGKIFVRVRVRILEIRIRPLENTKIEPHGSSNHPTGLQHPICWLHNVGTMGIFSYSEGVGEGTI